MNLLGLSARPPSLVNTDERTGMKTQTTQSFAEQKNFQCPVLSALLCVSASPR